MNENINLCEILKDCPKGTKFCSYIHGEVEFVKVEPNSRCPIWANAFLKSENARFLVSFTKEGYFNEYYNNQRCILVPSFEQQDWGKWKCPKPKKPKFDPKTLNPFDKVLSRYDGGCWSANLFSHIEEEDNEYYSTCSFVCNGSLVKFCIPYNDDTKHLVGTKKEAPEYYRYWEE